MIRDDGGSSRRRHARREADLHRSKRCRYVTTHFAREQGLLQAVEEVAALEHELRREQICTGRGRWSS